MIALSIFGTDFSLIEKVFGGKRTRESIKNKFRKEERASKQKIDNYLANRNKYTLQDYESRYGAIDLGLEEGSNFMDEDEIEEALH